MYIMALISRQAEQIVNDVLSATDEILAISIMDMRGNILAAKSKDSFKQAFGVTRDGEKYGGSLAIASLSLANEVRDVFGEAQAIIAIYENCKMMLLPIPAYQILVGFVFQGSVNVEGYNIDNKIERLLADTIESHNSNL
jgi:hypothetical protein